MNLVICDDDDEPRQLTELYLSDPAWNPLLQKSVALSVKHTVQSALQKQLRSNTLTFLLSDH